MDDRQRFFDRPTPAEERAARRAAKRRQAEDAWAAKVEKARRERKEEIERRLAENDPTPWWQR